MNTVIWSASPIPAAAGLAKDTVSIQSSLCSTVPASLPASAISLMSLLQTSLLGDTAGMKTQHVTVTMPH